MITRIKSKDDFVKLSNLVHGNKYDYSKVVYKDMKTKVCIICPIHGEFYQSPWGHLIHIGCINCYINEVIKTQPFLKNFKKYFKEDFEESKFTLKIMKNEDGLKVTDDSKIQEFVLNYIYSKKDGKLDIKKEISYEPNEKKITETCFETVKESYV